MKIAEIVAQVGYHVTPTRNIPRIMQQGLVPKTGMRARLLSEPAAGIYLFPSVADAENAIENWLGDQFGETVPLALLEVKIPPGSTFIPCADYEIIVANPIPPENITIISRKFGW